MAGSPSRPRAPFALTNRTASSEERPAVPAVTKRYDDPIEVTPDPYEEDSPVAFSWRGRRYQIHERLAAWRETTEMWDPAKMRDREYHRVLARPAGALNTGDIDPDGFLQRDLAVVFDVYQDRIRGAWRLARIWD